MSAYDVACTYVSTTGKPSGKRFAAETIEFSHADRESAWKRVRALQRHAANAPQVALVNVVVRRDDEVVWSLF